MIGWTNDQVIFAMLFELPPLTKRVPFRITSIAYRSYSTTRALARNRIYDNSIRSEQDLSSLLLLSASSRIPLITFWTASWCPTCKTVSPIIRQLIHDGAGQEQGGVSYAEIEIDAPTAAGLGFRYQISSVPTLLAFDREEAQVETKVTKVDELKNKDFVKKWIEREAARHGEGGSGGGFSLKNLFGKT